MKNNKAQLKNKNFFIFGFLLLTAGYLLLATPASAWIPGQPIVPCGGTIGQCVDGECFDGNNAGNTCQDNSNCATPQPACTKCELLHLVKNIIDFIMIAAAPILATVFFIVAGIYLMLGGANPGMLANGKRIFSSTFIGILIVMLAWLITNTLIQTLIRPGLVGSSGSWWQLNCSDVGLD